MTHGTPWSASVTIPHLQNCPHSGDGWCLDCVKELAAASARAHEVLFQIEQVGHNPADLAGDLCGLPDRYEKLVDRLAAMANDACRLPTTHTHDIARDADETLSRLRRADGIISDCAIVTWENAKALVKRIDEAEHDARLYQQGYAAMGAADISEYLALCRLCADREKFNG